LFNQVDEPVGVEVGYTDRLDPPGPVQVLHGTPGAVVVAVWLVNQVEVKVIQSEKLQRSFERLRSVFLTGVLDPELGGDEQLLAADAAALDGASDGFLVGVGRGGVDQAVPCGPGIGDDLLGLLGRYAEDAEAEQRHLDAVIQRDGLDSVVPFDHPRSSGIAAGTHPVKRHASWFGSEALSVY
jgi:hypothetical protein